ncbi:MAG: tetratricopeptide repeat protein, partial [Acidobacteriota bacterium]
MTRRADRFGARTCGIAMLTCLLAAAATAIGQSPARTTWQALDRRAEELYVKGTLPEAIEAGRLALSAATTPAERGQSLGRLGMLLNASGQNDEAEQHLRASLRIREETFGGNSLEYAEAAHDLAVLARDTGRSDEAATLAARAVGIRRRLPSTDPRLAQAL